MPQSNCGGRDFYEEFRKWKSFIEKIDSLKKEVKIGIIGKYFDTGSFSLIDSYISVIEAVKHAAWANDVLPRIVWVNSKDFETDKKHLKMLSKLDGIIVPGGFGKSGVEGKILAIQYAREHKIPYLGLCYGMQLAVIEFARNVCGLENANTVEIDPECPYPVIDIMFEQKELMEKKEYGATMRLGAYPAVLKKGTLIHKLYGTEKVSERHRHRYEVNPEYVNKMEKCGLVFSGRSPDGVLMEFMELPGHPYFVGTQAHPEFKSRPMKPAPMFDGLIKTAKKRK